MPWFRKNIISGQVIKSKSDKLRKKVLRDAKKHIKKGDLFDSHSFALYLQTIDARFTHLKIDVANSTRIANYAKVRAQKVSETRLLLEFFDHDQAMLANLNDIVIHKAEEAGRTGDLKEEALVPVDISSLKEKFEALERKERHNDRS